WWLSLVHPPLARSPQISGKRRLECSVLLELQERLRKACRGFTGADYGVNLCARPLSAEDLDLTRHPTLWGGGKRRTENNESLRFCEIPRDYRFYIASGSSVVTITKDRDDA